MMSRRSAANIRAVPRDNRRFPGSTIYQTIDAEGSHPSFERCHCAHRRFTQALAAPLPQVLYKIVTDMLIVATSYLL